MLKPRLIALVLLSFVWCAGATAQEVATNEEVLTNDKILTMVRAGLPSGVIVNKVRGSKTNFNTSTDELIRLHQAQVPEQIITAMVQASNPSRTPDPETEKSAAALSDYPRDVGMYL